MQQSSEAIRVDEMNASARRLRVSRMPHGDGNRRLVRK
jgi:hypothetical protein